MIRTLLALSALFVFAAPAAHAGLFEITADMQACTTTADCTVVPDSCTKACATVPVNTASADELAARRLQSCGESVNNLPTCATYPPMESRCVNNRCTVAFAFDHTSDDNDYGRKAGSGKSAKKSSKKSAAAAPKANGEYKDGSGFLELPAGYDGPGAEQAAPAETAAPAPENLAPAEEPSVPEIAEEPAPTMDMTPADMVAPAEEPAPAADAAPDDAALSEPAPPEATTPTEAVPGPKRNRVVPSETVDAPMPADNPAAAAPAQMTPSENFEEVEIEDDEPQTHSLPNP